MPSREDNDKELYALALVELRELHKSITSSFDNLRTKALALLAGEIAIVTFLFSSNESAHARFFRESVPIYGVVFYGIGIALLSASFLLFLNVISSVTWSQPPDDKDVIHVTDRFNHSPLKFMSSLRDDYVESINHCASVQNVKSTRFMWGIYCLSIGIFVTLMLKYGGGIIKI